MNREVYIWVGEEKRKIVRQLKTMWVDEKGERWTIPHEEYGRLYIKGDGRGTAYTEEGKRRKIHLDILWDISTLAGRARVNNAHLRQYVPSPCDINEARERIERCEEILAREKEALVKLEEKIKELEEFCHDCNKD